MSLSMKLEMREVITNCIVYCEQATGDINRFMCPCSIACFAVHFFPSPEARYIESRAEKNNNKKIAMRFPLFRC